MITLGRSTSMSMYIKDYYGGVRVTLKYQRKILSNIKLHPRIRGVATSKRVFISPGFFLEI